MPSTYFKADTVAALAPEPVGAQMRAGAVANLPVSLSVAAYGSVLGMLAAQKGIGWLTLLLMNLSVFAGSAQFVMVEMWAPPLPIAEMVMAVLAINLRYLLIGASLQPLFAGRPLGAKLAMMHLVGDENWAVTLAAARSRPVSPWFLFGGGLCLISVWCFGTLLGHRLGAMVADTEAYALDFAFVAVFLSLAVSLWRGRQDMLPWGVAAALAAVAAHLLPGKWSIVIGGVGGALVAAVMPEPDNRSTTASAAERTRPSV